MFKVGDKVRVVDCINGHGFKLGTVGIVVTLAWDSDYIVEANGTTWYLTDKELELVSDGRSVSEEKTMNVPFNISDQSIAVFYGSKMYQVPASDARYAPLKEALKSGNYSNLEELLDLAKHIERVTFGKVTAGDGEVLYDGKPVHGVLANRLIKLLDEGFDITPWANFLDNLMKNPSYRSRNQLYGFLEKYDAPLTEDGHFIAFKGVRMDYTDHHTGKFNNSVGQVVTMDRTEVDDDPNNTCSSGLHACATEYLSGGMFSGDRIVVLKINPRDVVSIPTDYNFSKMRVCQYEVIDETTKTDMDNVWSESIYG